MTEFRQTFRVSQTRNINGFTRTIDFMIDKGKVTDGVQHIVLKIQEDINQVLSVTVDKMIMINPSEGNGYKFTIKIEQETNEAEAKIMAEITVHGEDKDFWWFRIPEDKLTAQLRERGIESIVNEFVKDVMSFLSSNISVNTKQE
ncbi:MAG: hypothetical protein JHC26_09920 [Thermofilum sp.]|uniref:hypothetical protein n=1 Tax=Thermofilum sp. TaxID=1961369 RepID=UPI0025825D93|nr:hypothetical protein [Thermofilum sp.]MCI4409399.1 hypothetical protein [Thermofilum sp.]